MTVPRRVFSPTIRLGLIALDQAEAHHVRDVMRSAMGDALELFDAAGQIADARIESIGSSVVIVRVDSLRPAVITRALTLATAVPKADRADWLVEKLSELGVTRWIPLRTARSVVHPAGEAKFDRWRRIAIEAAKQSRRVGVMEIGPLTRIDSLGDRRSAVLSTRDGGQFLTTFAPPPTLLLIGPEGGWTDVELSTLLDRGVREASLTSTVLRVETAAIVAAGITLAAPT